MKLHSGEIQHHMEKIICSSELRAANIAFIPEHILNIASGKAIKQRRLPRELRWKIHFVSRGCSFSRRCWCRAHVEWRKHWHAPSAFITFAQGQSRWGFKHNAPSADLQRALGERVISKKMLTLSLSIDSVAASVDRIRTRPWLLIRMSLGPSAPAGMPAKNRTGWLIICFENWAPKGEFFVSVALPRRGRNQNEPLWWFAREEFSTSSSYSMSYSWATWAEEWRRSARPTQPMGEYLIFQPWGEKSAAATTRYFTRMLRLVAPILTSLQLLEICHC